MAAVPRMPDEALVAAISAAIAAHDPLDPWLVVSNYDEHYWDDVAAQVAPAIAEARSEKAVRKALAAGLRPIVSESRIDRYASSRIDAAAAAIWQYWAAG